MCASEKDSLPETELLYRESILLRAVNIQGGALIVAVLVRSFCSLQLNLNNISAWSYNLEYQGVFF